jgi:hypothetical protein
MALSAGFLIAAVSTQGAGTTHTLISGGGDGSWATSGNWSNGVPDAAGDTAAYSTSSTSATVTLDKAGGGAVTIGKISKTASGSFTINLGTASGLILDNTGGTGNASIANTSGSGSTTIKPNITFTNTDLTIQNAGGGMTIGTVGSTTLTASTAQTLNLNESSTGTLTINSDIGGSGSSIVLKNISSSTGQITIAGNLGFKVLSISQEGANSLVLAGDNSAFVGNVTTVSGTLNANTSTALSSANTVLMNGGNFSFTDNVTIAGLSGSSGGNAVSSATSLKTLTLGGSGNYAYSGTMGTSGQGNPLFRTALTVALTGSGSQTLTGDSYFSGGTTITSGTLLANNASGSALGTGSVAVDGGVLGGTGFIGGATAVTGGQLAAGTDGTAGILTFDSTLNLAALSGTGQLKFDLGAVGASDKIVLSSGLLSIGSGLLNFDDFSFSTLSGFVGGTFTLLDTSTTISGTLGSSLTGTVGGLSAVLSSNGQDILLTVSAIPEPSTYAAFIGGLTLAAAVVRRRRQSL